MAPCRSGPLAALLAIAAALHAPDARAGIRPYIWTWDTQIVPQGDVELEQWLWVRGKMPAVPNALPAYWIWWGPVLGVTEHLEIATPFQTVGTSDAFSLESFEVDARYRIFSRNDDGKLQPLVRAAFHQAIRSPGFYSRLDVNAVLSYGSLSELHATVDLGARVFLPFLNANPAPAYAQLTYGAGVSYPFTEELHAGLEVFGELDAGTPPPSPLPHHFVGFNAGYKKGRIWVTAGMLVGLSTIFPSAPYFMKTPQFMPRLIWAVAL
ncbi:MAG TPA: hypothetical protein VFB81_05425 [Myxococcales bacterium]|nr:hypothetical protein [Myxococcales bacterium]